jgi:hypothetical protein
MKKREYQYLSVRVHGLNPKLLAEIKLIAKNKGVSVSKMLKPVLQEYVNAMPPRLRVEKKIQD